jgi:hypothetical protein
VVFRFSDLTFRPVTGALGVIADDGDVRVAAGRGQPYVAAAADVGPTSEGCGEAAAHGGEGPRQPQPPPFGAYSRFTFPSLLAPALAVPSGRRRAVPGSD